MQILVLLVYKEIVSNKIYDFAPDQFSKFSFFNSEHIRNLTCCLKNVEIFAENAERAEWQPAKLKKDRLITCKRI